MALTFGFYNSLDGDREYDALDVSKLFDGIIRDGVFASIGTAFAPVAAGGLQVNIGIGRAWLDHTWTYNDSIYPITLEEAETLQNRIDAIVIEVDSSETVRANSLKVIKGTPASTPQKPTLTNEGTLHQYPLCYITRGFGTSVINQADIDTRVGTDDLPFVTGLLEVISLDTLLGKWQNELDLFIQGEEADVEEWLEQFKADLQSEKDLFDQWQQSEQEDFNEWFNTIKGQLSGDVAGNLQVQITNLEENKENKSGRVVVTMEASKWSGNTYSFEDTYPASQYNIEIFPNGTCDEDELDAYNNALILSNLDSNICKALGDLPTIDIPIIVQYRTV